MIDFKDVTFIMPVRFDSEDRRRNFRISTEFLLRNFDTNIIVMESDKDSNEEFVKSVSADIHYVFDHNRDRLFHRTRLLNDMTKKSTTPIIANYDVDVIFPLSQYIDAKQQILDGYTFSFPYDGHFYDIPERYFGFVQEDRLEDINLGECICFNPNSWGGAFLFDKEKYRECGWENEKFVSWGHEDWERIVRLEKLGHKVGRTEGNLYHLTHYRDHNSSDQNPFYRFNGQEFNDVKNMPTDRLKAYIKSWKWT